MIEGTAHPCVFQTFAHPTSLCSVCSILQLPDCLTEQSRGEVGWANVWKTRGVLSVLLLIFIFGLHELFMHGLPEAARHVVTTEGTLVTHLTALVNIFTGAYTVYQVYIRMYKFSLCPYVLYQVLYQSWAK